MEYEDGSHKMVVQTATPTLWWKMYKKPSSVDMEHLQNRTIYQSPAFQAYKTTMDYATGKMHKKTGGVQTREEYQKIVDALR
jgi:hypothetical protein